jgi:hypothetical protein
MDYREIFAQAASQRAELLPLLAQRFDDAGLRYGFVGRAEGIARLSVALDDGAREQAVAIARGLSFETALDCVGQSHHVRGAIVLELLYLDAETSELVFKRTRRRDRIPTTECLEGDEFLALCAATTRGYPYARETSENWEPFTI